MYCFKIKRFIDTVDVMMTSVATYVIPSMCGDISYERLMIPGGNKQIHLFYEDTEKIVFKMYSKNLQNWP
jgi:hypothetical protein